MPHRHHRTRHPARRHRRTHPDPPVDDDVTDQMADATYADDAVLSVAVENDDAQPVRDEAAARPGTGSPRHPLG